MTGKKSVALNSGRTRSNARSILKPYFPLSFDTSRKRDGIGNEIRIGLDPELCLFIYSKSVAMVGIRFGV